MIGPFVARPLTIDIRWQRDGNGTPNRAQGGYGPAEWNAGMFAVLNDRTDIKPAGWDLVNPLAPTLVSARIAARYGLSSLTTPPRVTKDQAWYWDVKLDEVTLSRLLQFDLVYLPIPSGVKVQLSPEQRDILRKLVDSGSQLWIDYGGGPGGSFSSAACGVDSVFFGNYDFAAGGARQPGNPVSRHHPILSYPFWLNQNEINRLGSPTVGSVITGSGSALAAVVTAGSGSPYIAAGQYGSGHVIMTSTNVGQDIARAVFGNNASLASPEDLKLAVRTNLPSNQRPATITLPRYPSRRCRDFFLDSRENKCQKFRRLSTRLERP